LLGHGSGALNEHGGGCFAAPGVDAQHDAGVEKPDQCLEIATTSRCEEGIHDLALSDAIHVVKRWLDTPHPAPSSAGQLAGRFG
jgi:hypothetical protein